MYMVPHSLLWHYLWIAPCVLQASIVYVIICRGLYRRIPAFVLYSLFIVVIKSILFILDHDSSFPYRQYWLVDFVGTAISIVLRFAVTYEVYSLICRPYSGLQALGRVLLRWSAGLLLLAAVVVSAYAPGGDVPIVAGLLALDRGVSLIQCGLLLVLFLFSTYFHLSSRSYVFGIAVGMGVFSAVDLAVVAIRITRGPTAGGYFLDFVNMAAYHAAALIWLSYLLLPEPGGANMSTPPDHNLDDWNRELQRILQR